MRKSLKVLSFITFTVISALVLSCGGGGGGSDSVTTPGGGGGPVGTGGGTGPGMSVALQAGTYWDFFWNIDTTTLAQPGTTTNTADSGQFRLTLGQPVTIQGAQAFPVTVSGPTGTTGTDFKPRWTHLAYANGVLQGSRDGSTLQTILDATQTSMTGGGFFVPFDSTESVGVTSGTFSGNYNTLSGIVIGHSTAAGGCETILGQTICSDTATTFSETEYHKDGVGPLGMKRSISYTSGGGGFFTSTQIKQVVELVGTTLTTVDGSVIKQPPWKELAPMNTPRKNHAAAVWNGKIFVFGGFNAGNTTLSSVEIYDPAANTWTAGTAMPAAGARMVAATVGSKIYLANAQGSVMIFDALATSNSWTTVTPAVKPFDDPSIDGALWTTAQGVLTGDFVTVVTPNGATSGFLRTFGFRVQDNKWYGNTTDLSSTDHRGGAVTVIGNNLYVAGGYRQFLTSKVFGNAHKQDLTTEAWTQNVGALNVPRYSAKAVTLNGEAVLLGGQDAARDLRDVEAFGEATGTWRTLTPMFRARRDFAAVVLNGKIYAIGGLSGSSTLGNVEVYTPQ